VIYLLPGLDGSGDLFGPLLEHLPDSVRVVSYPLETATWEDFVSAALEQIDTEAPFVLFAESASGLIALRLLAERGDQCRGFVACATFLTNPAPLRTAMAAIPGLVRLLGAPPAWAIRTLLLTRQADQGLTEEVGRVLARVPPETVVARLHLVRALELEDYTFGFPHVYVRGERDRIVSRRSEEEWLSHVRGSSDRAVSAPGPHLLAQEEPALVARLLLELAGA
jgi:pimeloyl-[acyl-carrier protein] methyl ester esterase